MSEKNASYGLLSETSTIEETRNVRLQRHLPPFVGIRWLGAGWRDLTHRPIPSLAYGLVVFLLSIAAIATLLLYGRDYILFPALAGFMIVAPLLAIGLYEKSRLREQGGEIGLRQMLVVKPAAGPQVFFTGVLLSLLMLLWMRSAVLIYALFFGVRSFPGLSHITAFLVTDPVGWIILGVGTMIGGLFAAFAFAISVFAIPMLLDRKVDALTAMGTSMALVWNNLAPMIVWGGIVLALFVLCVATGLLGLIVIFPWIGHATWHAYRAVADAGS
ncbi:DUF2189 domain-containing protein [Sphingobium vermicomposti]|uniref:Putative membrane protein n=1 Tax=Sphingobium vermicomposti TaxID=529005 RepID=A0A846M3V7_9SPHN|nr:DUF2189 domain-containing protein [Sphingobium vermicomposti]NIJ15440.1 putative membrane protein [Sphingobium vermicomposti]